MLGHAQPALAADRPYAASSKATFAWLSFFGAQTPFVASWAAAEARRWAAARRQKNRQTSLTETTQRRRAWAKSQVASPGVGGVRRASKPVTQAGVGRQRGVAAWSGCVQPLRVAVGRGRFAAGVRVRRGLSGRRKAAAQPYLQATAQARRDHQGEVGFAHPPG